jgi:3'(2'), 5'-bisphosphate nucleotidase
MPLPSSLLTLLYELACIAGTAGSLILALGKSGVTFSVKGDGSPVSQADKEAEGQIMAGLAKMFPGIPALGEETAGTCSIPDKPVSFFLIDPLDGTREFAQNRTEYTVNIAFIDNGRPVFSVLHAPALGQTYVAERTTGAWRANHAIGILPTAHDFQRIEARPRPRSGGVAYISRSHLDEKTRHFLQQHPAISTQPLGSSLKFARLAEGAGDLYPRFSPIMEWDTAAGDALLTAAGGAVLDAEGNRLLYGKHKEGYRTRAFIASGKAGFFEKHSHP